MNSTSGFAGSSEPANAKQVLVCFAVRKESRHFNPPSACVVDVLVTGMGLQKTSAAIERHLADHSPDLVLTCGFAGGLRPSFQVGDVLFDCFHAPQYKEALANSGAAPGKFAHADRVLVTAKEKEHLFAQTGADAVEMESSAVVSACRSKDIPVAIVRVISDGARDNLPLDFNRFSKPDGSLNMPRLLAGIGGSPSTIPKLVAFNRQLEYAAKQLGSVLARFLTFCQLS